jgi:hypothetical protein
MALTKSLVQPLVELFGKKALSKPMSAFLETGLPKADIPGLINLHKAGPVQVDGRTISIEDWMNHTKNFVERGEQGGGIEATFIQDEANKLLNKQQIDSNTLALKHTNPIEIPKQPNVVVNDNVVFDYDNIPARQGFDMGEAEELMQTPEMQKAFADKQSLIKEKTERMGVVEAKTEADYPEGKFYRQPDDVRDALRDVRDAQTGANPEMTRDLLGPQAEAGYGVVKGKSAKTAHREASLGWKPDNKGRLMNLEQHHAAFPNAEGSALMDQRAIQSNPTFELAIHRYVARKYDAAFGAAAKNMANLPYDVHQKMLHRWLEQFDLEDYWRAKLKANPNMSPAEIMSSIDEYFQEIVFPTMAMLEGWMAKSNPAKFNTADVRIPKKLTADARSFLKKKLKEKAYDASRGGTRDEDLVDVMIDKYRRQTNDGAPFFKLRVPTEGMNL